MDEARGDAQFDAPDAERGSLQARLLRRVSGLTLRRVAAVLPVNRHTLVVARKVVDCVLRGMAPVLSGTRVEVLDSDGVRGEWVWGPRATPGNVVVLYVHGGGFVAGSPSAYRGVTSRMSTALRAPVFAVGYRLAPEHHLPAASLDVAAAYGWLLDQGYGPRQIVIAGDSAGGYLAADLVMANARDGKPAPAALVLFSPMADLSLATAAAHDGRTNEGLLSMSLSHTAVGHYVGHGQDRPELRPTVGTLLPPTLIHASTTELFGGDAIALADRLREAGAWCELQMWPDQIHIFQVMPVVVPESRLAYRSAARFVRAVLGRGPAAGEIALTRDAVAD